MGVEVEVLDSGCCGMAGGWGYERGHYDVSVACGERALLPKVREAPAETLLVADGFSCRSQIEQCRDRPARAARRDRCWRSRGQYGPAGPRVPCPGARRAAASAANGGRRSAGPPPDAAVAGAGSRQP